MREEGLGPGAGAGSTSAATPAEAVTVPRSRMARAGTGQASELGDAAAARVPLATRVEAHDLGARGPALPCVERRARDRPEQLLALQHVHRLPMPARDAVLAHQVRRRHLGPVAARQRRRDMAPPSFQHVRLPWLGTEVSPLCT
jgi:hypothetical protein